MRAFSLSKRTNRNGSGFAQHPHDQATRRVSAPVTQIVTFTASGVEVAAGGLALRSNNLVLIKERIIRQLVVQIFNGPFGNGHGFHTSKMKYCIAFVDDR